MKPKNANVHQILQIFTDYRLLETISVQDMGESTVGCFVIMKPRQDGTGRKVLFGQVEAVVQVPGTDVKEVRFVKGAQYQYLYIDKVLVLERRFGR